MIFLLCLVTRISWIDSPRDREHGARPSGTHIRTQALTPPNRQDQLLTLSSLLTSPQSTGYAASTIAPSEHGRWAFRRPGSRS